MARVSRKGKGQVKAHKFGKALPKSKGKGQAKAHRLPVQLPIETNDSTWTEPVVTTVVVDPNTNNNQPINQ